MLVIRLARGGRNKYPVYRIVAAESARAATGKFIEVLGHYNPHTKELSLKKEEIAKRLSHGAQPSNSVVKLLMREKVELPSWVKLKTKAAKAAEPEADAAIVDDAAAPEVTEEEAAAEAADTPVDTTEAPEASDVEPAVAVSATAEAAEIADNATPAGETETAETTEAAAEKAQAASEKAAKAATEPESK
jgi:small subunit ribosomal protein S16